MPLLLADAAHPSPSTRSPPAPHCFRWCNQVFTVVVTFAVPDGAGPLALAPTRNCTDCCHGNASDFDVSADRASWYVKLWQQHGLFWNQLDPLS